MRLFLKVFNNTPRSFQMLSAHFLILGVIFLSFSTCAQTNNGPEEFVEIKTSLTYIQTDVRYAGENNFVGRPIPGYVSEKIILSIPAADALHNAIAYLNNKGYGVIIYDAYRPQKAVDYFLKWARNKEDTISKSNFYPDVAKRDLFQLGYIASKSGHSRGS